MSHLKTQPTPTSVPTKTDDGTESRPRAAALRLLLRLGVVLLISTTGACIEFEQLIRVNKDGSGELFQEVRFSRGFFDELATMGTAEDLEKQLLEMKEGFKASPELLASGLQLVDVETIPAAEGNPLPLDGFRYSYRFDDLTKLDLNVFPDLGAAMGMPVVDEEDSTDEEDVLRFEMTSKGKSSIVSLVMFESEEEMQAELDAMNQSRGPAGERSETDDAMLEMAQELLSGFRLKVDLEVVGKIENTNAAAVDDNRVTLIELDFDRMFAQKEDLLSLPEFTGQPTLAQVGLALQDIDGLTIPTTPRVSIEFR